MMDERVSGIKNKIIIAFGAVIFALALSKTMLTPVTVYAGYRPGATNRNINMPTDDPIFYYESPWQDDGTFDYYHYPIYDDPMYISDEEFFGVWNSEDNVWSVAPYFRYSEYPGMAGVESAAKNGDYLLAKEELLNYYKGMKDQRVSNADITSFPSKGKIYLESMARNLYPNGFLSGDEIGFYMTGNDWKTASVDVRQLLNEAKGSYPLFNVMVSSVDKYYTTAEICSRESSIKSDRPVLRAIVNGVEREFEAVKDAEIIAGDKSAENYGSEDTIRIQEHGTYMNYDDTTMRAHIAFDISELAATDTITSAKIELRCRNNSPNGKKEISLHWFKDSSWDENTVCWDTFTDQLWFSCNDMEAWDYVTSSVEGVKGKVCGYHRDEEPDKLAKSFAYSGDERYAYNYIRHIMALINGIGLSTDVMNSLDMSNHVISLSENMYRCITSEYMTPNRFTAMLKHCWMLSRWQVNSYFGTGTNNYATYAAGSVYDTIARFPELKVHDEWLKRVRSEYTRMLGGGTYADGMCIELSMNYIKTILGTYATPLDTAKDTGEEIPFDDELYQSVYDTIMTLVYSKGPVGGFNLGDGYDTYTSYASTYSKWWNYGLFDNSALEYLATNGASGRMPDNPTTHYPVGMRTYMRSSWDENALQLAITNNVTTNASHYHKDALSLVMFAYGKCLLSDQGYGSLLTGDSNNYMKSPVQHNLVTVNDIEDWLTDGTTSSYDTLARGPGIERAFESNKQYDYIEYATEQYTTTRLSQRSVLFLRDQGFWIVTDYHIPTDPEQENLFAQHWHMYPGSNMEAVENNILRSNFPDANVKVVPIEHDEIDDVRFVDTRYSEKSGQIIDSQKAMYLKTKEGTGRFTTVLLPMKAGEDIQIETGVIETGLDPDLVNAAYFRVTSSETNIPNTYYYYHINDESRKQDVDLGEFKTDAATLLVQKDANDKIVSVFMMDGSYLTSSKLKNKYLIKSDKEIPCIAWKKSGADISIASSSITDDDLKGLTIYADGAKSVYDSESGSTVECGKQGGYFYFGGEPILDVEDEPGPTADSGGKGSGDRSSGTGGNIGSFGGGGGGSASSFGSPAAAAPTDTPSDAPSASPEPSGAAEPIASTDQSYSDVEPGSWYYDVVEQLTALGVVSGGGDGRFYPDNRITREEFLKMLLLALNKDLIAEESTFKDVENNAWYRPYVMTAKELGIVIGIEDDIFGVGENILRQDMAVLIDRMPEVGEIPRNDAVEFDDMEDVSDYAKTAVIDMRRLSLIEGFDNRFNPDDDLTRAEAATVIVKLLNALK